VKPIVIIAISVVCSVIAVIAVQSFSGVNFSDNVIFDSGELLRDRNGNEFGTEKFVLIPQIQEEIRFIDDRTPLTKYLEDNYKGNPTYNSECQRVVDEQNRNGTEYGVQLWWIFKDVCRVAVIVFP